MGLDECRTFIYSAAPMGKKTQEYFISLDMPPLGLYGMTETSAAATTWSLKKAKAYTAGSPMPGLEFKIDNPDKDGIGEICMKGRSCFMGYYKNEQATMEVYDSDGFVHSGDLGIL